MQSIRLRLTLWYTFAMTVTLAIFAAGLYWERRQAAVFEQETRLTERLTIEADFAERWLNESWKSLQTVVVPIEGVGREVDTSYVLVSDVSAYFEGMGLRDYLAVSDNAGRPLYVSARATELGYDGAARMRDLLARRPLEDRSGLVRLAPTGPPFRYQVRRIDSAGPQISALLVAAQPEPLLYGPRELLRSMLIVAPLIVVASSILGYWLAANSLRPVDAIINEIEAITDGRSLHRRLASAPGRDDELGRLATTLNAMLARIETSFTALRRFTADASHELKTPLMVLRAGVERSLTHPGTPGDVVATLDETLRQVNTMNELVTNLLTLARADEGRASLSLEPADLRAIVVETGETAEILGEERGIAVSVQLPDEPVILTVDPVRVRQLLLNLMTNAVKYTPEGSVTITLAQADRHATIAVRDTGIGIAAGDLANIFDRFWRADPARSRAEDRPGVGLGLSIAKWITEAHGGTIAVQSRPGRGTTFVVTLPLDDTATLPGADQ